MATSTRRATTKSKLLSLIEEAESLTKKLTDTTSAIRQGISQKSDDTHKDEDDQKIMKMLIQKNEEIESTLKQTEEQREKKREIETLQEEVDKRDDDIKLLQKQLKEAEHILAQAIYQAREKLKAIERAKKGAISADELIKYAHRISATNAVSAPLSWAPGDPRRPYPTDLEMRMGILGRLSNLPPAPPGANGMEEGGTDDTASGMTWQPSSEITASLTTASAIAHHGNGLNLDLTAPGHNKENEDDVEVMSSDSSSSSSSDSP